MEGILWRYGVDSKRDPESNALLLGRKGKALKMKNKNIERCEYGHKKASKAGKAAKIKHTAHSISMFGDLKIKTPLNLSDVPATQEKLEAELLACKKRIAELSGVSEEELMDEKEKLEAILKARGDGKASLYDHGRGDEEKEEDGMMKNTCGVLCQRGSAGYLRG